MTFCNGCRSKTSDDTCCSLMANGLCAGRCDRNAHTYESVSEVYTRIAAAHEAGEHENGNEEGGLVSDCTGCGTR